MRDLHALPRFRDGLSFLYVERVRIDQDQQAILLRDERGRVPVPVPSLSVLMLGPGSTITHAAVLALADNGCSIVWCGETGVRFYAAGGGETHKVRNLVAQARVWADPSQHLEVVKRLYRMRFPEELRADLTLEQLSRNGGRSGARGLRADRARDRGEMERPRLQAGGLGQRRPGEPRPLDGECVSVRSVSRRHRRDGVLRGLGFIHTGKMLSFVYDVADLYKSDITIPVAFEAARDDWKTGFESRVRKLCRHRMWERKILERVVPDIQVAVGLKPEPVHVTSMHAPDAAEDVTALWAPDGDLAGGHNYGDPVALDEEVDSDEEEGIPF